MPAYDDTRKELDRARSAEAQQEQIKGDVEVFRRTVGFKSHSPLSRCPVLHRSATNDFDGWMDDVYHTKALIQVQPTRYS